MSNVIREVKEYHIPSRGHAIMTESKILLDAIRQAVSLREATNPRDANGIVIYFAEKTVSNERSALAFAMEELRLNEGLYTIHSNTSGMLFLAASLQQLAEAGHKDAEMMLEFVSDMLRILGLEMGHESGAQRRH